MKKTILLAPAIFFLVLSGLPLPAAAGSTSPNSLPKGVSVLCSNIPYYLEPTTGIVAAKGGAYVETQFGDIVWCAGGSTVPDLLAVSPSPELYYYGMAGTSSTFGEVLVLSDNGFGSNPGGFYMCIGVTPSGGCFQKTGYIAFPSSYCSTLQFGGCFPAGIAIDSKLNVYFVDSENSIVAKCTYASRYQSCTTIETLSIIDYPTSIFRDHAGNIWVTDVSCHGDVWENGVLQYSLHDSLGAITESSANPSKTSHLYIAINGGCGTFTYSFVFDVTDARALPSPYLATSTTTSIYGLSTSLQFTAISDNNVYTLKDSK